MKRSVTMLLFVGSLITSGRPALAEDPAQPGLFNRAVEEGEKSYKEGNYELAIVRFQTAYSLKPDPFLLYNLGLAHYKQGRDAEALHYFEFYLRTTDQVEEARRKKIDGYMKEIQERAAKKEAERQKVVYLKEQRGPRPKWRLATGATMLVGSAFMLGFGGRLLSIDGRCLAYPVPPALECSQVFQTTAAGTGLTIAGGLLAVGGIVLMAIPGSHTTPMNATGSVETPQ